MNAVFFGADNNESDSNSLDIKYKAQKYYIKKTFFFSSLLSQYFCLNQISFTVESLLIGVYQIVCIGL